MNRKMTVTIGDCTFPAKWAICQRCRGNGHHGNPAFDGTTTDWWLEGDPDGDDLDAYMSGRWDVNCEEGCDNGKILVPDEDRLDAKDKQYIEEYERDMWSLRQQERVERMMGA